jgi:hypothetical protein
MKTRQIAELIVTLRLLLITGMVSRLMGDTDGEKRMEGLFEALSSHLPTSVQRNGGLIRRVSTPAQRKIDREGILAQRFRPK